MSLFSFSGIQGCFGVSFPLEEIPFFGLSFPEAAVVAT